MVEAKVDLWNSLIGFSALSFWLLVFIYGQYYSERGVNDTVNMLLASLVWLISIYILFRPIIIVRIEEYKNGK